MVGANLLIIFVVDEEILVTEVMRRVKLTTVDDLASAIAAPSDMELPLVVLHQLVVRIERTYEYFTGVCCHLDLQVIKTLFFKLIYSWNDIFEFKECV